MNITTEFDIRIPMRDGITLSAHIIRPTDSGKYPALLTRTPYNKDLAVGAGPQDVMIDLTNTARQGYVIVIQDTRGHSGSEGDWDILPVMAKEGEDGEDTVSWIVSQPWSNGVVGTFGGSYLAFTQWQLMGRGIQALKAAIPTVAFDCPSDGFWYRNGALELGLYSIWALGFRADGIAREGLSEQDLQLQMWQLFGDLQNWKERIKNLPLSEHELFTTNHLPASSMDILRQGYAGEACRAGLDNAAVYDVIDTPSLMIGGWYDVFLNGTLRNFTAIREKAPREIAENTKLVIGPWSHWSRDEWLAQREFGSIGSAYGVDLYNMHVRWFDHYLKGIENGIDQQAPILLFVMGANIWREENEWPLARTQYTDFYLESDGKANTRFGDGRLSTEFRETTANMDHYIYDPANPVETVGGTHLMHPYYQIGPKDYRVEEEREDVLVYTSDLLEADLEVTGPVKAKLWVSSSARDTDFVARLLDVAPDGTALVLTDGVIRARYRDYEGTGKLTLLTPNEPTQIDIDLWATSNVFKAGHRIRVEITSSCFPRWDRNANTGNDPSLDTEKEFVAAKQCVLHDKKHPSKIILPIIE